MNNPNIEALLHSGSSFAKHDPDTDKADKVYLPFVWPDKLELALTEQINFGVITMPEGIENPDEVIANLVQQADEAFIADGFQSNGDDRIRIYSRPIED